MPLAAVAVKPLSAASRYEVERTWRELRNGPPAASTDDCQLGVGSGLQNRQLVESRSDLVQDEKSDGGWHSDISNKPPE